MDDSPVQQVLNEIPPDVREALIWKIREVRDDISIYIESNKLLEKLFEKEELLSIPTMERLRVLAMNGILLKLTYTITNFDKKEETQ